MQKLSIIITLAYFVGSTIFVNAQNKPLELSRLKENLSRQKNLRAIPVTTPRESERSASISPQSKTTQVSHHSKLSQTQTIIGTTTYDLQSNASMSRRIYKSNGTVGASWIYSNDLGGAYPDRGTGYSFFDGTSWSPNPTGRLESDRRGWASMVHLANGTEYVVSHSTNDQMVKVERPNAGSGTWTQNYLPAFTGGEYSMYPKTAAGGPDGNTVHLIDISTPAQFGGQPINGIDGCLNYNRSLDGGQTWDILRSIPSGVNDSTYFSMPGDRYNIDAKDNVVAFTFGNIVSDWVLWKSIDNGTTFTKTVILDFPFTKYDMTTQITDVDNDGIADTILVSDSYLSILIDNNGMVHLFSGAMYVIDDDPTGNMGYFRLTDGLMYWNESMGSNPPVVIATAPDNDGNGVASSFAADIGGIYSVAGLCTMASSGIDAAGNIYVAYSPLIENTDNGMPSPYNYSYRNVYIISSSDGGSTWSSGYNVSNSDFDEAVHVAVAREVDNCVSMIWQQDGMPGNVLNTPNGGHPISQNDIIYDCVDVNLISGTNSPELINVNAISVYPNPAKQQVTISYQLNTSSDISIEIYDITGKLIETINTGTHTQGAFMTPVDLRKYDAGVYLISMLVDDQLFHSRFVKE